MKVLGNCLIFPG